MEDPEGGNHLLQFRIRLDILFSVNDIVPQVVSCECKLAERYLYILIEVVVCLVNIVGNGLKPSFREPDLLNIR